MNVSVIDLSSNQKKLQVEIPAAKVQEEMEARYRELAKSVRIKGFRPGKVPRSLLKSYYGKNIESEVSSKVIQETFPEALREADLKPLIEADVSEMHFEDNGAFTYTAVVDICPPFQLEGYKGLEVRRPATQISEEQENAELERLRDQHAQISAIDEDRPVQEEDMVVLDFAPWVDGVIFERGKTDDYMMEVGKHSIHPDFDGHIVGHRAGESFSFEVDYPEDAPTPEIQGKRVRFHVTIKELKKKTVPELNDELAKEVGRFDTLEDLKQNIRDQLQKRDDQRVSSQVRQQIVDRVLNLKELELSPKVIDREVDRLIGMLQHQFESQGLKIDTSKFNTPEVRAEYRPQAEKNLRQRLFFQQIAKQEGLELSEEEREEIYRQVARFTRMDVDTVRQNYAQSPIVEQSEESKIQEKVFQLLEQSAVYSDEEPQETQEPQSSDQE